MGGAALYMAWLGLVLSGAIPAIATEVPAAAAGVGSTSVGSTSAVDTQAQEPWCPRGCTCVDSLEFEFSCVVNNVTVTVNMVSGEYIKIVCKTEATVQWEDFPRVRELQNAILPQVSVKRCGLPASYQHMLQTLGLRVQSVQQLWLREMDGQQLSRHHLASLPGLRKVDVGGIFPTPLPADLLADVPTLRSLAVTASDDVYILPGTQLDRSPTLHTLEISNGNLSNVPAGYFRNLNNLKNLYLWENGITSLEERAFEGLTSLEQLDLSSNRLGSLAEGIFRSTPNLRSVSLFDNILTRLPNQLFTGLVHLQDVGLYYNGATLELAESLLAGLPALRWLCLDQCMARSLPPDLLAGSTSLQDLSLADNGLREIPPTLLRDQVQLRHLNLSDNQLTMLSPFLFTTLSQLEHLNLDGNQIEVFREAVFDGLTSLLVLSARRCRLRVVADHALRGPRHLTHLSLAHNELGLTQPLAELMQEDYIDWSQSPFNKQIELQHLDLSHNHITDIFSDWRNNMLSLRTLDLSYNRLLKLSYSDVNFLSNNITVDLRHNNLSELNLFLAAELQEGTGSNAELLLADNPFHCGCSLYPLLRHLQSPPTTAGLRVVGGADVRCTSPPELSGMPLLTVPLQSVSCNIPFPECPHECTCIGRPVTTTQEMACSTLPSLPPPPARLHLRLTSTPDTHLLTRYLAELPSSLTRLQLSDLNLTELILQKSLPPDLMEVDLSRNNITRLDEATARMLLSDRRSVNLSANMLSCKCEDLPTLSVLQEHWLQLSESSSLRCTSGEAVGEASAARLCGAGWAVWSAGVLCAGLALAGLVLVLWRRHTLAAVLWAAGCCRGCLRREEDDGDAAYDVFVSHAHQDETFVVDQLVPRLEGAPMHLHLCLHFRDWTPGDTIPAQVERSVQSSRRTLVVLSPAFLESDWGRREFLAAQQREVSERINRIVVIILGEIAPDRLGDELAMYLRTNTYVKWGDPWFWQKLQYALPSRSGAHKSSPTQAKLRLGFNDRLELKGMTTYTNDAITDKPFTKAAVKTLMEFTPPTSDNGVK